MAKLGWVGLGAMGGGMAKRLLDARHAVCGYNRTPGKARWLADAGLRLMNSPREVAENSEIIFTMVTDTAALEAVTHGTNGILAGLHSGATFVEMSTVSPEAIRALGAEVAKRGASLLDAPVSGSIATLEAGQLSIMVAGDAGALERARPYLTAIGPTIIHVGELGLAKTMKIATNLSLAVQMLAFSEAVLLAEKAGITRESAVDVLVKSVIASPMIKYRGPFVLNMPDEAWFDVNMMQKDMLLALELGRELDVSLPTTAITNEMLTAARALGLAKKDFAIVFEALARMSGVRNE